MSRPKYNFNDYIITRDGNVISPSGKTLKGRVTKNGYLRVIISGKYYYIHRLVADAFIPNEDNKPQIDHKNGNKKDNRVENLRWVTSYENMNNQLTKDKIKNIMIGKKRSKESVDKQRKTIKSKNNYVIVQLNKNNQIIATYDTIADASYCTNLCASDIGRCCSGKRLSCGGYKWVKKY